MGGRILAGAFRILRKEAARKDVAARYAAQSAHAEVVRRDTKAALTGALCAFGQQVDIRFEGIEAAIKELSVRGTTGIKAESDETGKDEGGSDVGSKAASEETCNEVSSKVESDETGNDVGSKVASDDAGNDVSKADSDEIGRDVVSKVEFDETGNDVGSKAEAEKTGNDVCSEATPDVRAWLQRYTGDWSGRRLVQNMLPVADTIFELIARFNRNRSHIESRLAEGLCNPDGIGGRLRVLQEDWEFIDSSFEIEDEEPAFDLF